MDNEQIIRKAYQMAEDKDSEGWLAAFAPDRTFGDRPKPSVRATPA